MHACRTGEEGAVDVAHAGIEARVRSAALRVQIHEELAEVVVGRALRVLDQAVNEAGKELGLEQAEVLGEHDQTDWRRKSRSSSGSAARRSRSP
jgi:hypothetical protein